MKLASNIWWRVCIIVILQDYTNPNDFPLLAVKLKRHCYAARKKYLAGQGSKSAPPPRHYQTKKNKKLKEFDTKQICMSACAIEIKIRCD